MVRPISPTSLTVLAQAQQITPLPQENRGERVRRAAKKIKDLVDASISNKTPINYRTFKSIISEALGFAYGQRPLRELEQSTLREILREVARLVVSQPLTKGEAPDLVKDLSSNNLARQIHAKQSAFVYTFKRLDGLFKVLDKNHDNGDNTTFPLVAGAISTIVRSPPSKEENNSQARQQLFIESLNQGFPYSARAYIKRAVYLIDEERLRTRAPN